MSRINSSNIKALTHKETSTFSALFPPRNETSKPSYLPLRKMETAHLDCGRILRGDLSYTKFVARNRPFLLPRNEASDCNIIRKRVLPPVPLEKMSFGIAYARIVYRDYEFIEDELRSSYHPQNYFCYSIDQKADKLFQWNIENLATCFPNVIVTGKFNIDEYGRFMNNAHYECMQLLRQKRGWGYLLLLQNHDVVIKSQYEMVEIYKLLGGANDVEITPCPEDRWNHNMKWDAVSLNLFKNPLNASHKQLNTRLTFAKGAVQASLSRAAIEWIVDVANLTTLIDQLNDKVAFFRSIIKTIPNL
ncbi:Core-2/I-Branching enzyme [Oesophagostomum dentatum]|uniref:Core-2/I-Branching enzyme n=1 Tax=Oesophagostomum dentatum TaxID=61180 RepID=A0A0B1SSK1_OESDE|nr:Core-2/I-Branching enzyme [Oesophagostomum dentatum]